MTCEGEANTQQEHIGVKMLIYFFWCMENIGFLMSTWWLGKKKAKQMHQKLLRQTTPCCCCLCSVWQRGGTFVFMFFFLRTILFCHVAEDLCSHKPSARLPEINPLWKPGSAAGKLSPCSGALRSLNPWASWGQSSLMKSQYLDGTVPRICKHAA